MPRKFTFKEYWDALNPEDPVPLKESILHGHIVDKGNTVRHDAQVNWNSAVKACGKKWWM